MPDIVRVEMGAHQEKIRELFGEYLTFLDPLFKQDFDVSFDMKPMKVGTELRLLISLLTVAGKPLEAISPVHRGDRVDCCFPPFGGEQKRHFVSQNRR
jgi:hypothetical protein